MASWALEFCLACDKQVLREGAAYCSEACRLAELEKTSTPSSPPASPGFNSFTDPWASSSQRQPTRFYLSPAYDFRNARPYGTTPSRTSSLAASSVHNIYANRHVSHTLSPSSSHSSLSSMHSMASINEAAQLSDATRKELTAYAISFEQVRTQRRRSY